MRLIALLTSEPCCVDAVFLVIVASVLLPSWPSWLHAQPRTRPAAPCPQVGVVESVQQQERKSGAEAWSMRVQERVVERLYVNLLARYLPEDIPFHRIVFYKQCGVTVW